jgi:hypothetical protein
MQSILKLPRMSCLRPHRSIIYAGQYGGGGRGDELQTVTYDPLILDEQQISYNIRSPPTTTIDTEIRQYSNNRKYKLMSVCR